MDSLREILQRAQENAVAVGHFNVADLVLLKGVFTAAQDLNLPVLVGASEGEREFMGVRQIAALVRSLREEFNFPVFLNADHTHSLAGAMEAAKAGFDAVVFDLSALPFEENVRQTREAVKALKTINPSIVVEGEIGDIGSGSEIHDSAPNLSQGLTNSDEAKQFVESTGVDVLAPAVGNMHGMLRSMVQGETRKHLDIARIAQIKNAARVQLTLQRTRKTCARLSRLGSPSSTSTPNCGWPGDEAWSAVYCSNQPRWLPTGFCPAPLSR
jgi:fructose-bisphosphate aldolase, class II